MPVVLCIIGQVLHVALEIIAAVKNAVMLKKLGRGREGGLFCVFVFILFFFWWDCHVFFPHEKLLEWLHTFFWHARMAYFALVM